MRQILFTLLVLISLSIFVTPTQPAHACSGGDPGASIDEIMQNATIVLATVVERDDAGVNVVLHVESYLRGEPAGEYLLFQRTDPVLTRVYYEYGYDTGCTYGGAGEIGLGTRGYFALLRSSGGTYVTLDTYSQPLLTFPVEQWWASTLSDPMGDMYDPQNRTALEGTDEASFLELLERYGDLTPTPPLADQPYPLTTPLLITTDTGAHYLFPVDRHNEMRSVSPDSFPARFVSHPANAYPDMLDLPPSCAEAGCVLHSPDLRLIAEQTDAQTITLTYPYREWAFSVAMPPPTVSGQAFAFSRTGEALLVWNGDQLDVYLIQRLVEDEMPFNQPQLRRLTSLPLSNANGHIGAAEWSADGSTLLYADDLGLWVFDLWRGAEPNLIMARQWEAFPSPVFVSSTGRYLGMKTDANSPDWLLMDTHSGELFENGLVSADERRVALLGRRQPLAQASIYECAPPMASNCPLIIAPMPQEFAWLDNSAYYVVGTSGAYYGRYDLAYVPGYGIGEPRLAYEGDVIDVAYEPHQGLFVTVTDDHTLAFSDYRREFDLSEQIDGAITRVEWLPPLFYYAN